jgi:hypothetical protein
MAWPCSRRRRSRAQRRQPVRNGDEARCPSRDDRWCSSARCASRSMASPFGDHEARHPSRRDAGRRARRGAAEVHIAPRGRAGIPFGDHDARRVTRGPDELVRITLRSPSLTERWRWTWIRSRCSAISRRRCPHRACPPSGITKRVMRFGTRGCSRRRVRCGPVSRRSRLQGLSAPRTGPRATTPARKKWLVSLGSSEKVGRRRSATRLPDVRAVGVSLVLVVRKRH